MAEFWLRKVDLEKCQNHKVVDNLKVAPSEDNNMGYYKGILELTEK
jgi:hypothetical protein